MDGFVKVIGENVRRIRQERQVSLAELAARSGVAKATLAGLEKGRGNPTLGTLLALARGLQVAFGALLGGPPRAPAPGSRGRGRRSRRSTRRRGCRGGRSPPARRARPRAAGGCGRGVPAAGVRAARSRGSGAARGSRRRRGIPARTRRA